MPLWVDLTLNDAPFPDSLAKWLVEVRVEMELSRPTRFALRLEDDVCSGDYGVIAQPDLTGGTLQQGTTIGVFAKVNGGPDNGRQCLVRGPVTKLRSASTIGGTGSWTEAHGEDRRITMSHNGVNASYTGRASAVVQQILKGYKFDQATVQQTLIQYDEKARKLTQNGDDLAFVEGIARSNNMEFWVEYAVDGAAVTETAHLETSPHRDTAAAPTPTTLPQLPVLKPQAGRVLIVQPPPGGACANVTKFDTRIDFEKPTAVGAFTASSDRDKKAVEQIVHNNEPFDPKRAPPAFGNRKRVQPQPPPDPQEAYLAVETSVLEQSWFVEVDCSSTLELLNFAVRPHQILTVQNAGKVLSGLYQVTKATYVINAADQFIDFSIRANGLGAAA